jgi:hypothetical protein
LASPLDEFDALILMFAQPVTALDIRPRYRKVGKEYNPFREPEVFGVSSPSYDYDQFG